MDFEESITLWDNYTTVEYESFEGDSFADAVTIPCLFRAAATSQMAIGDGSVPFHKSRVHFQQADLTTAGIVCKVDDRMTDSDGVRWDVDSVDNQTHKTRTACNLTRSR